MGTRPDGDCGRCGERCRVDDPTHRSAGSHLGADYNASVDVNIPDHAACRKCGYSLRALSEPRCPECGRAFDPSKPRTFYVVSKLKRGFPFGLFVLFTVLHLALVITVTMLFIEPIQAAYPGWGPVPFRLRAIRFFLNTLWEPFFSVVRIWRPPKDQDGLVMLGLVLNSGIWGFCLACIPWALRRRRVRKFIG